MTGGPDDLLRVTELVVAYDDLLRAYAGPLSMLCAGDSRAIDAAYDELIAAARAATAKEVQS